MSKSSAKFLEFQHACHRIDRRYRIADNKEAMVLEAVLAAYIDAKFFFYVFIILFGFSGNLYAQSSKGNAVACYEEVIKEPAIFMGTLVRLLLCMTVLDGEFFREALMSMCRCATKISLYVLLWKNSLMVIG